MRVLNKVVYDEAEYVVGQDGRVKRLSINTSNGDVYYYTVAEDKQVEAETLHTLNCTMSKLRIKDEVYIQLEGLPEVTLNLLTNTLRVRELDAEVLFERLKVGMLAYTPVCSKIGTRENVADIIIMDQSVNIVYAEEIEERYKIKIQSILSNIARPFMGNLQCSLYTINGYFRIG